MASDKVIGIDLGTTNSCVAIVEDGTPSVIPNRGGYKTTPSMVAIAENGKRLVGHIAKRQAITNAENTVFAAKRLIGRKWGSAAVRTSIETMPYRIVEGPHDDVRIMLRDQVFSVPEASNCGGVVDWAYHMVLPWTALAIVTAGVYVRFVRAEVMETMNQDYVRTARAKGAPERTVMKDHILRNALLPVVTILGMDIGILLGGAIFIETVFGLNGLGATAIRSIGQFDLPTLQGVVIFGALAIIIFTLIVDLLYAWIDPRIRLT